MNFGHFFNQTLGPMGFDIVSRYNAFSGPYHPDSGWPITAPNASFDSKTLVILHFQDFVTLKDNRCLELEKVERAYNGNLSRVLVTYWTSDLDKIYQGPINLIKFSNHNYDLAQALADSFESWSHILDQPRPNAWQCLNGRITQHRRRAVDILQSWPNGTLSLGTEIPLPRCDYSEYFGCDNLPNFQKLLWLYGTTAVNIVTETEYDPPVGIVTEKTLLAIAAQQIPIVIGHRGIVQHCRGLGFDMFDDLVDISYDDLDNHQRVEQALLRNKDLILGKIDLGPYQQRLAKNRRYLLEQLCSDMRERFLHDAQKLATKLLDSKTA